MKIKAIIIISQLKHSIEWRYINNLTGKTAQGMLQSQCRSNLNAAIQMLHPANDYVYTEKNTRILDHDAPIITHTHPEDIEREITKATSHTIIVHLHNGVIQDVTGLQPSTMLQVCDYNIDGSEHNLQTDKDGRQYAASFWLHTEPQPN